MSKGLIHSSNNGSI